VQFGYRVGGSGVGGGHEIHIVQAIVNVQGGTAPAPARPTGNAAASDPNAALYARLQAQHEEHNRDAARDEAARREAARAREAAAERARRDEAARLEAARLERARAAARVAPTTACRVCGGNFPHPACSGCGTPGARAAATTAQPGHSSPPSHSPPGGLISTDEIAGCWVCMCFPFGATAIFSKEATGPNSLKHAGLILSPVFWPFEEHRIRHPGTNGFYKVGEPQDVDQYDSSDCACNGLACSMKVC